MVVKINDLALRKSVRSYFKYRNLKFLFEFFHIIETFKSKFGFFEV